MWYVAVQSALVNINVRERAGSGRARHTGGAAATGGTASSDRGARARTITVRSTAPHIRITKPILNADMRILPLLVLLACVAWPAAAQEEGEARAPPRGLLKRGPPNAKGKTTTTTPPPLEDAEYEEEPEEGEGEHQESATSSPATSSTTEGKKLVANGVRPFRSNSDLLEILKKRRAEAAEAKLHGHSSSTTQEPPTDSFSKSNNNKKKFNTAVKEGSSSDEVPSTKSTRGRFGKTARSIQESQLEEDPAPARPSRLYRRGN